MESICVICNEDLQNGTETVELREKGSIGINNASRERGDSVSTKAGQRVHEECRRTYINPNIIKSLKRQCKSPIDTPPLLRSEKQFSFKDNCIFCGISIRDSTAKRKRFAVHAVQTTEFQTSVEKACTDRNDEWGTEVKGRLEFARDLHAADAVYHNTCSANFRTGKNVPQIFSPKADKSSQSKRGRPTSSHHFFLGVAQYLEENDDEQVTITDLVDLMQEKCGEEAYTQPYMKYKLKEHYGTSIVITELNGKENVVTFRQNASNILHNFYKESINQKSDEETKLFLINTVAALIRAEIRSMPVDKNFYPSNQDILSPEDHIPSSLSAFLNAIFSEKDSSMKVNAIGQAIVQATRPRLVIQPLQIGLAVQMHHMFGSRFLIDTLNNMGFCSSYSEVQKFESSAVISTKEEAVRPLNEANCLQYVADNVDHNINTIDGNNTFHGMGIISCLTPGLQKTPLHIRRLDVTTDELISCGHINMLYYNAEKHKAFSSVTFPELTALKSMNSSWKINVLMDVVRPLRSPMPGWSGTMQMLQEGNSSGVSDITFLPMIDLNPSDMNCIYSTLMFVSKEASRYQRTPIITFDQPLYWKSVMITHGEECKNIIVRLGGFHTEMSFLGTIGRIMSGTGLREILELIYAPNAVTHMLTGKAVSRAVRGFMLVDAVLQSMIAQDMFGLTNQDNETANVQLPKEAIIDKACDLYDKLYKKDISICEALETEVFTTIEKLVDDRKNKLKQSRTSKLWLCFSEMVAILKRLLLAERTGDWELHLATLQEMLPYLAAAGHNLYTKSAYFYLSQMQNLESTHPNVYAHFMAGKHVVRRSERFWSGLSTDLIIEQVLMKSVKSTGGLTRGRGMGEAQRAQWLLSMPTLAEYNLAMQQLTGIGYQTSDQHVESGKARTERDVKDTNILFDFLKDRSPFTEDQTLRNIETGMVADRDVNVDNTKEVGDKIVQQIAGQSVSDISFKKKDQVITLELRRPTNPSIVQQSQVDPQLMFQRLTAVGQDTLTNTSELFSYELSSFPSSMFEANGFPKQAAKATLGDAIWNMNDCHASELPETNVVDVIDGGSLLHRIPWTRGQTFSEICSIYVDHVKKRFRNPVVVMDGYNCVSTKDITHMRRNKGVQSNIVTFTKEMPLRIKKETFLMNESNKHRFVEILVDTFNESSIEAIQAQGDADLLIVQTADKKSEFHPVIVYGEDTDLLVLLCHYAREDRNSIFFTSDKQSASKTLKVWDISKTQRVLGVDMCRQLPFIHAMTGCDTTSRLHGIGKPVAMKKLKSNHILQSHCELFLKDDIRKEDICKAGEEVLVGLYGGMPLEGLDLLRWI